MNSIRRESHFDTKKQKKTRYGKLKFYQGLQLLILVVILLTELRLIVLHVSLQNTDLKWDASVTNNMESCISFKQNYNYNLPPTASRRRTKWCLFTGVCKQAGFTKCLDSQRINRQTRTSQH